MNNIQSNGIIIIKFRGRFGNRLFMYFLAKLYSEQHNLNLTSKIDNIYFKIKSKKDFRVPKYKNKLKIYKITDNDYNKDTNSLPFYGKGIYVFDGYFQFENIFYLNKNKILNYIDYKIESKDIFTLHLRLGDYYSHKRHLIISIDYYIDCIKKYGKEYNKIYIICDKLRHKWEKEYMKKLINKIKLLDKIPIYKENSIQNDIKTIIDSKCIITSNSTFCFWATFFSGAEKIITFPHMGIDILPNRKIKKWGNNPIIFKYDKEDKYIFNKSFSNDIIDFFEKKK